MSHQNILTATDQNFQSKVLGSSQPVLVDLWADWCGPCRALGPTIDQLATEFSGQATVAKLNVDQNPQTAAQYGVRSIPTVLIIKNGQVLERLVGTQPKEKYAELLRKHA